MTFARIYFRIVVSSFFSLAVMISSAQALSLLDAYEAALENDPLFRAAVHENEAGQQTEKIGRAGLLPNL